MFCRSSFRHVALSVGLTALVAGCSGLSTHTETMEDQWKKDHPSGSIFGNEGGLDLFNTKRTRGAAGQDGSGIGVNDLLWRASLDTLSFLPLPTPPDPFGGVIVYDWYTPAETPNERFKVNVFILDRQLRADGIRVSVFKQTRDGNNWRDAGTDNETATKLEDAILSRARQIRSAQTDLAK